MQEFWGSLDHKVKARSGRAAAEDDINMVVLELSPALESFRDTIVNCFSYEGKFLEPLMKVKLQELILLLLETPNSSAVIEFFEELYSHSIPDPVFTVSQDLLKPLALGDYAAISNRSLSKFKRDFTASTGQPPGKWINAKRLEHAQMLTKTTNLTVSEICNRSGFNNLSSFIRSYKAMFGKTPSAQR